MAIAEIRSPDPSARWGVVVRTTDGSRWTRLPFPNTANLVGVTATSADAATWAIGR